MTVKQKELKELTLDIVIGSVSKAGDALGTLTEKALADSFRRAGNLDDLAARLTIPVTTLSVSGAKVIASRGADAVQIFMAIRSKDANAVARALFSIGAGIASAGPIGLLASAALAALSAPAAVPIGVALSVLGSIYVSNRAVKLWDNHIAKSPIGVVYSSSE